MLESVNALLTTGTGMDSVYRTNIHTGRLVVYRCGMDTDLWSPTGRTCRLDLLPGQGTCTFEVPLNSIERVRVRERVSACVYVVDGT